jgi:hypothetical protein
MSTILLDINVSRSVELLCVPIPLIPSDIQMSPFLSINGRPRGPESDSSFLYLNESEAHKAFDAVRESLAALPV